LLDLTVKAYVAQKRMITELGQKMGLCEDDIDSEAYGSDGK
jgi:hypothetical protein